MTLTDEEDAIVDLLSSRGWTDLAVEIEQTESELSGLIGGLVGSDTDVQAVATLQGLLGGASHE